MKLKKWFENLLIFVNIVIIFTISNNEWYLDLILLAIFVLNSMLIIKYGRLEE